MRTAQIGPDLRLALSAAHLLLPMGGMSAPPGSRTWYPKVANLPKVTTGKGCQVRKYQRRFVTELNGINSLARKSWLCTFFLLVIVVCTEN